MNKKIKLLRNTYGFLKGIMGQAEWLALPKLTSLGSQDIAWSHESIVSTQKRKWPALKHALESDPVALSINHEAPQSGWGDDVFFQHQILCFGHALALASSGRSRVSWLDYGGGLGQYYLYAKALFPKLTQDYTCFDLPAFCEAGNQLNPKGSYFSNKEKTLLKKYDFIFAGSSLWYDDNWTNLLGQLASCASPYLMVARQLIIEKGPGFVALQRPAKYGYLTEYRCWILNRHEFLNKAKINGLELVQEYILGDGPYIHKATEPSQFRAFLFSTKKERSGRLE